jgi:hypothetical protein
MQLFVVVPLIKHKACKLTLQLVRFETTPSIVWRHWFSWRYDAKYKEVRINIDNNDKKTWGLKQKEPKDKKKDNDYKEELPKVN